MPLLPRPWDNVLASHSHMMMVTLSPPVFLDMQGDCGVAEPAVPRHAATGAER